MLCCVKIPKTNSNGCLSNMEPQVVEPHVPTPVVRVQLVDMHRALHDTINKNPPSPCAINYNAYRTSIEMINIQWRRTRFQKSTL